MAGFSIGGVRIDPVGKTREAGGHIVGKVAGGEARNKAEGLFDEYTDYMSSGGIVGSIGRGIKDMFGGGSPTLEEGGLNKPELAPGEAGSVNQAAMINMLQRRAGGHGPSAAQSQLQQATDQNMRGALAMAASGRGNAALAGQAAGRQRAQMGQEAALQSASLRAQEQQQATGQLGQAISGAGQQELGYAGLQSQMYQADQNRIAQENAARLQGAASKQAGMMGAFGSLSAAALPIIFSSDEDVKKNKQNVPDAQVDEFFQALKAKSFEYKDPHAVGSSGGEKVGMMAQDVEGTKLGDKLFSEGPGGVKGYDPQVLDGILLAGMKKLMKDQNYGND